MKLRTAFLKRCLALVMALVLLASNANLGVAMTVFAGNADNTVTNGELIANNYALSDAEKALLKSGLLAEGGYSYNNLPAAEDLVEVDTDNKKISVKEFEDWKIASVQIVVGDVVKETVTLTNGVGTYQFDENAFSVKVDYTLETNVAEAEQITLLSTGAWLKSGVAQANTVADQAGNLFLLEQAMPTLSDLATNGFDTGTMLGVIELDDAATTAIKRLDKQMAANGDKLLLSQMITAYNAGKTAYILTEGLNMKAEVEALVNDTAAIGTSLNTLAKNVQMFIDKGYISAEVGELLKTLSNTVNNLNAALKGVAAEEWVAAEKGTALVKTGITAAEFKALDVLVGALGEATAVTVKNPLHVADGSVTAKMAMYDVTIEVVLNTIQDNELKQYDKLTQVITLAENTSAADVKAAIDATGLVNQATEKWNAEGIYDDTHYSSTTPGMPFDYLTEDFTHTVTFNPVQYKVTVEGMGAGDYYFGYVITLPVHEDPTKSYDYFDDAGNYFAQGTKITVVRDNMVFTRSEGKAYEAQSLLAIIANNYAGDNDKLNAILTSGALYGDETISYRKPTTEELEKLVTLDGNVLTMQPYASSYNGLSWEAERYVCDGVETYLATNTVTLPENFDKVVVYYTLALSNYTHSFVGGIVGQGGLIDRMNSEAISQKQVLDTLSGFGGDMSMLNMTLMMGLSGMVQNAEMKAIIAEMMDAEKGCFDANGNLILNSIIAAYDDEQSGGLYYYYTNDELVRGEINKLSSFLNRLLGKEEYKAEIRTLLGNMGFGQYADALDEVTGKLDQVATMLVPKNAAINTSNAGNLRKLTNALETSGAVVASNYDRPFISLEPVTRVSEKFAAVEIKLNVDGKTNTDPITVVVSKGEALTTAQVAELKAAVAAFVESTGINTKYYSTNYDESLLDALTKTGLDDNKVFEFQWTKNTYTVNVPGAAEQTVDIDNRTITLPAHTEEGYTYVYEINGKTVAAGIYTLSVEELDLLIAGKLEIKRVEKNVNVETLKDLADTLGGELIYNDEGKPVGMDVVLNPEDPMGFVTGLLVNSPYTYIGVNGEGVKYATAAGELEISLQALINGILSDDKFDNDRVIALAENNGGEVATMDLQLGTVTTTAKAGAKVLFDLEFTLRLDSAPEALKSNIDIIKTVSQFVSFKGNSETGAMDVTVNLPDQVYAAYAAALVATGHVDKTDVNELNNKVAVQFLMDYVDAITGSEMDLKSFSNTLAMLGMNMNLAGYNGYYNSAISAYEKMVTIDVNEENTGINVTAPGKTSINALMSFLKMNDPSIASMLEMVKEYKEGGVLTVDANVKLSNLDKTYYALVADLQASGLTNKVAAPTSVKALKDDVKNLAGYSMVMLLDDVDLSVLGFNGTLTFDGTTILDLNGKTITGNIKSTGTLYIIDSTMDTANAGTVTGNISGNVTVIAGTYEKEIADFLKAGYAQDENGTVSNALYHIVADDDSVEFVLNADALTELPSYKALALDMAGDLLLNGLYYGYMSIDGKDLLHINVNDVVGLYADPSVDKLVNTLFGCVTFGEAGYENNTGVEYLVNAILEDLLDFGGIADALENGTALFSHDLTLRPWKIEVAHVASEDYATVNVTTNADLEKTVNVSLTVLSESGYKKQIVDLLAELDKIVEDRTEVVVDIPNPSFEENFLTASAAGKANVYVNMSKNSDYATIVGVILAYGNSAKRAAVADAINNNNIEALKAIVDNTTVAQLFTALKAMGRDVSFTKMAQTVKVTADVSSAAALEAKYHAVLCAAGKVLEEARIDGNNSKLIGLYNETTGYYELTKEKIFSDRDLSLMAALPVQQYVALVELTATDLSLNVKLFYGVGECILGDVNHDMVIDVTDAGLVQQYVAEMDLELFCFRGADVNGDGEITVDDAGLIRQYIAEMITEFPAESK